MYFPVCVEIHVFSVFVVPVMIVFSPRGISALVAYNYRHCVKVIIYVGDALLFVVAMDGYGQGLHYYLSAICMVLA